MSGQQTRGPVRHAQRFRRRGQRGHHDLGVIDHRRPARTLQIAQPADPARQIPVTPLDHRRAAHPEPPRDLRVRQTLRSQQHDPRPLRQPRLHRRGPHQRGQLPLITNTQHKRRSNRHTPFSQNHTVKSLSTRDTSYRALQRSESAARRVMAARNHALSSNAGTAASRSPSQGPKRVSAHPSPRTWSPVALT